MSSIYIPGPAVFLISNAVQEASEQDEQDRSLLFASTPDPRAKACINAFKGLGLAVRGVLGSICGEKTRTIQLRQPNGSISLLAFAHLQTCMTVLALPGTFPREVASSLALQLSQVLVLLAGPSHAWLVPDLTVGTQQPIVLKPSVRTLLEVVCQGVLAQLEGPGWVRAQLGLTMQGAVLRLQLVGERQRQLDALLDAHSQGIPPDTSPSTLNTAPSVSQPLHHHPPATSASSQHPAAAFSPGPDGAAAPPFQFFRRHCCLLYRGLVVSSSLPPQHLRLVWQLCWALQLFNAHTPGNECQVITHKVYLAAPAWDQACGDVTRGSQRSLLVLAAVSNLVLAVCLGAYDEEVEDELAAKLEGQDAVELLQRIYMGFTAELERGVAGSTLLRSAAWPPDHAQTSGQSPRHGGGEDHGAGAANKGRLAALAAGGGNLLAKLVLTRARSRDPLGERGGEMGGVDGALSHMAPGVQHVARSLPMLQTRASGSMRGRFLAVPAVLLHVPATSTVALVSGDLPPAATPALCAEVWAAIAAVRAQFGKAQRMAVAPPPKHSRLTLTLGQIERLSALRAPREGGQRLGDADSAPWQYHPELASLATVQQATLQLRTAVGAGTVPWFVTGRLLAGGEELFCVHSADVDEGDVLDDVVAREGLSE